MKSYTTLRNMYGSLSQNTSATNLTLGDQLINDEHRYLLQKYFSNEGSFQITTVGSQSLTLTGTLSIGAISATLSSAWSYYTTTVQVTFSSGELRSVRVEKNSTALSWDAPLTATATASISVAGLQFYPLPPNFSALKDVTVTVGQLKWTPDQVLSREDWDRLNVFPYYSDIPKNFFIYPGGDRGAQLGLWPIPSTTGNVITYNYKYRVPDLSIADYTTPGSITATLGSTVVTGSGTSFDKTTTPQLESRWIRFSPTAGASATNGDNLWYQIASVDSTTGITLYQPYQGTTVTSSSSYTIGQMPILPEDFHDMLVYKALVVYFSTVGKDVDKASNFQSMYDRKLKQLDEYTGKKAVNVNLRGGISEINPNLFPQSIG